VQGDDDVFDDPNDDDANDDPPKNPKMPQAPQIGDILSSFFPSAVVAPLNGKYGPHRIHRQGQTAAQQHRRVRL
jgi:hypothetical protein